MKMPAPKIPSSKHSSTVGITINTAFKKDLTLFQKMGKRKSPMVAEREPDPIRLRSKEQRHSVPMRNLMKFQIPEIKPSQGERVCFKDFKNIFLKS